MGHTTLYSDQSQREAMRESRLRELSEMRGLTLGQLSVKTEIHKSYLSRIENGKRTAPYRTLEKLASFFDCKVDDLFAERSS
jgi:transcriptional regulator with XRE-family HTH domain